MNFDLFAVPVLQWSSLVHWEQRGSVRNTKPDSKGQAGEQGERVE